MIRRFEHNDLTTVMEIWLAGNLEAHSFIDRSYWQQNYFAVSEKILLAEVYVYEENGTVLGFVGLDGNYIAGIFVQRDRQSCGLGKKLLAFLKSKFFELNLNVYQKNNKALAFYLREDFKVIAESIDEYTGEKEFCLKWSGL